MTVPIAIVTPFYQRQAGLLRRAVQSVIRQNTGIPWRIVVIDDGSPISAQEDLKGLHDGRLTLIRQENRGVSAARNRGLDEVQSDARIVAFLDSDDIWEEGHLERIGMAMKSGADFYFEDFQSHDQPLRGLRAAAMNWGACTRFEPVQDLHWFEGDFFDALLKRSPARTSTVAYCFRRMPHLRFRESLWLCEDIFFWMEASRQARRIAVSGKDGAFCGRGVNISGRRWGALNEVRHHLGMSRYFQAVRSHFPLNEKQDLWTRKALRGLDASIWLSALAAAARGRHASIGLALSHMATRPQAVSHLPAAMVQAAQAKLSHIFARPH